jgi:hypothetical protein
MASSQNVIKHVGLFFILLGAGGGRRRTGQVFLSREIVLHTMGDIL